MRNLFFYTLLLVSTSGAFADYWYFELGLQWIPTICQHIPCKEEWSLQEKFVIDGLVPSGILTNYGPDPFDPREIINIISVLEEYWPQLCEGKSDLELWQKEWECHGRWSAKNFKQFEYFTLALKLRADIDPEGTLAQHGIIPDPAKNYTASSIRAAFEIGPLLYCDDIGQLQELKFCFNKWGNQSIPCFPWTPTSCPDEVLYPPAPLPPVPPLQMGGI